MELDDKKILSYLKRAQCVAENSPDEETKVGSILISKTTGSVVSEGYNGFVRGTDDSRIPKTRPAKYEYVIHAEDNLISNAARNGVRTDGCFSVQTHSPCPQCARRLIQAGIDTVYFQTLYSGTAKIKELNDMIATYTSGTFWTRMVITPNQKVD